MTFILLPKSIKTYINYWPISINIKYKEHVIAFSSTLDQTSSKKFLYYL